MPFLYFAGERLSQAELAAARLDGHLVEIGDAYMPADAVETPELRAGSLRALVSPALALTRASAAWIHGALSDPPVRHAVQRLSRLRIHHVIDSRLSYRDYLLREEDVIVLGGVGVTTPPRTLADLVRDMHAGEDGADTVIEAMIAWSPALAAEAADCLTQGPPVHFKRPAAAYLRARAQEEVTR